MCGYSVHPSYQAAICISAKFDNLGSGLIGIAPLGEYSTADRMHWLEHATCLEKSIHLIVSPNLLSTMATLDCNRHLVMDNLLEALS